ncbi:MAG: nicotinamide riboside transporter PnuC [Candidatus Nanopelagicales bacterium]
MAVAFTAWDFNVTYVELFASIIALVAVALAAAGTRWAWPCYFVSAALYAWLFFSMELLASGMLQLVFIAAAVWGWFTWGSDGVTESRRLSGRSRLGLFASAFSAWLFLAPALAAIGAAATLLDSLVLVGSVIAQVLMVKGYVEAWPAWVLVNVVGTFHYAHQELYFTSLLYFVLLLLGLWGWWQWSRKPQVQVPDAGHDANVVVKA